MEQIIVTQKDGTTYPLAVKKDATGIKQATQSWGLLGDDVVNITVESPYPQSYAIGDSISVFGRTYRLNQLPRVKRMGAHKYAYDLTFEGVQYDLLRAFYDVTIETTGNTLQDVHGDALTGDLRRFATVLISNANRVFPGKWQLGTCPATVADKTLTFGDGDNCLAVYHNLCKTFEVEATISESGGVYTIDFAKRVGVTHPFTFEFGKGKGLYALDRQNVDSSNIVTRLKVYGSSDNITNKYRAQRLCLPGKSKARSFIEQADAVARYGVHEARKVFDDIKPTFNGKITAVIAGNILQFQDASMFDLNTKEADGKTTKYLVAGVSAKIHFNTGNLAGYEFDISKYDHATKTFTLKKLTDNRGDVFPSSSSTAFQFAVGDEYKILDVTLPERYQQEAEQKLQERALEYYRQNSQPKVKYGLSVAKSYLQKLFRGGEASGLFAPGDYINVKDESIGVDKAVRIQSLERNLLDVYSYTLTLADVAESNITTRVISELVDLDKITTVYQLKDPMRARANWRSTREVLDMVFDPDGDYYTDKIKPNSVDTLALSVGAKSMQFALQDVVFEPNYQGEKNAVRVSAGTLTHYAVEEQPRTWRMAQVISQLGEDSTPYYIFARCPKVGNAATMIFSKSPIKVDQEAGVYHFWVGVVNSVDTTLQARSMSLTYGFSTINGRFIKTGRIESADGSTYFDLDDGEIGGRVMFTSNGQRKSLDEFGSEVSRQVASRSRVFTTQPTPPYNAGDIWVDGKVLRRCVTARASGAYVAGDWVLGVAYDNTKTTIDGGLVTSGTIQVAGSASAILAGVTGYGTTPDAVRFWAGATYENRADAPFVVLQDGTTKMSKANVSGIVDAKGGKIGGFEINDGRIGVANSYNQSTGLSLTNRNIRFRGETVGTTCFASIGVLNWLGYSNTGLFELTSNDNNIIGSALYAKCVSGDGSMDSWYPQRAIEYVGNVYGIGKKCEYETGYIGEAFTDAITSHYNVTHKFHFTKCGAGLLAIDLPKKEAIDRRTGGKDVIFNIEIVCDRSMPNTVRIKTSEGAQIYNNDGTPYPWIDMMRGDSLTLRYYNGAYHIVNKQFAT
jgi:hypothetical protein bfra3_11876|nr:MAG TPA: tail protein [Caudoviricetes sp.]